MGFDENAFMVAGTAIAILGVGLYIYDTRKDSVVNAYNQYRQVGGSRRHKKKAHKKTRKHN
jgi:hypothetical protein